MPNWCEGSIRFRGTTENIKDIFNYIIEETLKESERLNIENDKVKRDMQKLYLNQIDIIKSFIKHDAFYFINSNHIDTKIHLPYSDRGFIKLDDARFFETIDEDNMVLAIHYEQAWGFDIQTFINLANHFHVDIKALGFEAGMEVELNYEVNRNGEIINQTETEIKDYPWDSINPTFGG